MGSYLIYASVASLVFAAGCFFDPRKKSPAQRWWAIFVAAAGIFIIALGLAARAGGDNAVHYYDDRGESSSWFQNVAVGGGLLAIAVRIQCLRSKDEKP
jgi:hypothetical protein